MNITSITNMTITCTIQYRSNLPIIWPLSVVGPAKTVKSTLSHSTRLTGARWPITILKSIYTRPLVGGRVVLGGFHNGTKIVLFLGLYPGGVHWLTVVGLLHTQGRACFYSYTITVIVSHTK